MHGAFLEKFPDDTPHRRSGTPSNWGSIVNWSGIVINFSNHGFSVISEVRDAGTTPREYAGRVAGQLKRLLAADVQLQRTTVAGHSKGGAITLITAALLQNPDIKFIDMAGCGNDGLFARSFRRLMKTFGSRITGRLMSVYDADDRITGSQDPAPLSNTPGKPSTPPTRSSRPDAGISAFINQPPSGWTRLRNS
jgi:pimeloyl-ACP methyl ester carboxylesterase